MSLSAIIDWFERNNTYGINLGRIATLGFSLGGYLSPRVAAFNKRITCAVGNGGFGFLDTVPKKINPIWLRDFLYITGCENVEQLRATWGRLDIRDAPPLDRPLLYFQGGKDILIPRPKEQADYIMNWAVGEKELKYYPDGEHCCVNYLDEVYPYTFDWLRKHLMS